MYQPKRSLYDFFVYGFNRGLLIGAIAGCLITLILTAFSSPLAEVLLYAVYILFALFMTSIVGAIGGGITGLIMGLVTSRLGTDYLSEDEYRSRMTITLAMTIFCVSSMVLFLTMGTYSAYGDIIITVVILALILSLIAGYESRRIARWYYSKL